MSNTRYATEGTPLRQERYASCEVYKTALMGMIVARRCALLRTKDPELAELIWFLQERSLPDPFRVGWRLGSIANLADSLLTEAAYSPPTSSWCEDLETGKMELVTTSEIELKHARGNTQTNLEAALCELALSPTQPPKSIPGLGSNWRAVIQASREKCREAAKRALAPTSIAKQVAAALKFTAETGKPSLAMGVAKIGKSAAAKAFSAASGGSAKYIITPEDTDMMSLYRAIAKVLGVADGITRKALDVRESVERTLAASRQMLIFDEAQNLFSGARRVTKQPQRVLWVRRLIDSGVPVALVTLPEFSERIARHVDQLAWDASQIVDLIAKVEELPRELTPEDFAIMVERLAPELTQGVKKLIASTANSQRGAQYAVDVIEVARHLAAKQGRKQPTEADVKEAIGMRPQFNLAAIARVKPNVLAQHAAAGERSTPPSIIPSPLVQRACGLVAAAPQ